MKTIKLSIITACILAICTTTAKAQTADEIMAKHEKAIGGLDNWNKIKTVTMKGSISQQGRVIDMVQTIEVGKAMRLDITTAGKKGFQIITTTGGWSYMPIQSTTQVDTMKPEMVASGQIQFHPKERQMVDYRSRGTKVELAGTDTVKGTPCYKILAIDKDGEPMYYFIDMKTWYIILSKQMVRSGNQKTEVDYMYNNYQKLDHGIVMPMSVTVQNVEVVYTSIEVNKPVDEKIFIPKIAEAK